jgi:hypothetical protein
MHRRTALAAAAALVAGAAACSSPAPTGPTPSATPPVTATPTRTPTPAPEAPVVEIEVDADGALTMRTDLDAGAYVFRVASADAAEVTILDPEDGYTPEDLAEDFGPHDSAEAYSAATARLEEQARSLGGAWSTPENPGIFAQVLAAGTYWFVDLSREPGEAGGDDTLDAADVVSVTVTGTPTATVLPEHDAVAEASEDRSWRLPESLPAAGSLLLRNETESSHRLILDPVPPDSTAEEWLALTREGRGIECPCHSPAGVGAGTEFLWSYDLPPGDYLVMDLSISELGYPQYNGAGATTVTLD